MPLRIIAEELKLAPSGPGEAELRACFANLVVGIEQQHIDAARAERRLLEMASAFNRSPVRNHRTLLREHDRAMSLFGTQDHYFRPGPLNDYLDRPAVTIQANEDGLLGMFWLSPGARASAADIASAFDDGACIGVVGAPDRAIWLTPLTDEVEELLKRAQDSFCTPSERADIGRRMVALLGLAHIKPTAEILAMVTRDSMGDLLFDRPDDRVELGPAGSTAIEARGHRRFRAWPQQEPGPYGRTYDTDEAARAAAASAEFGALEAVSCPMPMSAFQKCIVLGSLTAKTLDDSEAYLEALGVKNRDAADLLLQLSDMIGL